MILNALVGPGQSSYLPPAPDGHPECGECSPQPPFIAPWTCTREEGHDGDHAAHHDLGRMMNATVEHPDQIARWPREEEASND